MRLTGGRSTTWCLLDGEQLPAVPGPDGGCDVSPKRTGNRMVLCLTVDPETRVECARVLHL